MNGGNGEPLLVCLVIHNQEDLTICGHDSMPAEQGLKTNRECFYPTHAQTSRRFDPLPPGLPTIDSRCEEQVGTSKKNSLVHIKVAYHGIKNTLQTIGSSLRGWLWQEVIWRHWRQTRNRKHSETVKPNRMKRFLICGQESSSDGSYYQE